MFIFIKYPSGPAAAEEGTSVHGYGNIIIHNIRDRHVLYGVTKSFSDLNLKNNRKL